MSVLRAAATAALGLCVLGQSPAAAQFFFQSKDMRGQPVRGDEPGVLASPMPGATDAELRAGLVWTMRAGLNVAALQCQFEPSFTTVRNYNAMILDHRDELKSAFDTLTKYYARTAANKAEGQRLLDQFGTRTYSSFSSVAGQLGFCRTANAVGRDANFAPRGLLGEFAQERMQELRNSLTPYGEQAFPYGVQRVAVSTPPLTPQCWNKKGDWQVKKCGAVAWRTSDGVGVAAR